MHPIALYYPYVHIQDENWLKYAALYWPKLARLRPSPYTTYDSPTAQVLHQEAGWLLDIEPPHSVIQAVGHAFTDAIVAHTIALEQRFGINHLQEWHISPKFGATPEGYAASPNIETASLNRQLGYVHVGELTPATIDAAVAAGLAVPTRGRTTEWLGMHPALATTYTCALVERIALENHLHPITDEELALSALYRSSLDRNIEILLDSQFRETPTARPGIANSCVMLAFATAIPDQLDRVPVERILEVREKFKGELDSFRLYVTEQAEGLAALESVRDVRLYMEYLNSEVRSTLEKQLNDLGDRLRSVNLGCVRGLVTIKSVALPTLAAAAADFVGLPPAVAGPAVLAAHLVNSPVQWHRQREDVIRESPVGYLLRLRRSLKSPSGPERLRRFPPSRAIRDLT
ncbi:DUF6236 family protein [Nocardia sp. NPDC127526]|uniref:DUF6236 family protein n=1 Tax=Nocardia sp. NPDC127526 TaxID=3345393 RepID=UPI00363EFFAC